MKNVSCCGADCYACLCYGNICKGCNESKGILFHTDGKPCAVYECKSAKRLSDCSSCAQKPCSIWKKTRDPHFTDEEFQKNIEYRLRVLNAVSQGKYVQTPRLTLMPLDVSDADAAFVWCSDPEVTKFMNYNLYDNVSDVAQWIAESGCNCFGFFLRENGRLIGSGDIKENKSGVCELGYNLAKEYWGRGYCTEAAKAMLAYKISQGVNDFACEHAKDNVRSGRVIQKCGFTNAIESSYTSFDGKRTFKSYRYSLHIDSHEMNVDCEWFDKIIKGEKTVELRLNDEKRKTIKSGDYVTLFELFEGKQTGNKCVVKVTALHTFADFAQLYGKLDMSRCGYGKNEKPNSSDMLKYYSLERQREHGVLGIEFELSAWL